MKFNKKILCTGLSSLAIIFSVILGGGNEACAVTVGDQLVNPESGWTRYEDYNSNITYANGNWVISNASIFTNSHCTWTTTKNAVCKFNFNGSKIRILSDNIYHDTQVVNVKIDGEDAGTFSEYRSYEIGKIVCFERTNLSEGEHSIEMTTMDTRDYSEFVIDAIDLEDNGEIMPYHEMSDKSLIKVRPDKIKTNVGECVKADITIGNIENITSGQLVIKYDSSKLKYDGIESSDGIGIFMAKCSNGKITAGCRSMESNLLKNKVLFSVKFTPLTSGNAVIKIEKGKISSNINKKYRALQAAECGEEIIMIS